MSRFRTALASISVGVLLATGSAQQVQGAQQPGPKAAAATGGVDPSTLPGPTGSSKPKPSPAKPKPKPIVPDSSAPASAEQPEAPARTGSSITTDPNLGLNDQSGAPKACDGTLGPPRNLIPIYIQASKKYALGERGPQILAAINRIETDFGRLNEVTSSAGAIGWMQFMPATWDAYGVDGDGDGKADPYNARDAIHSAANYLSASGAPNEWYDAIWAYNHADWYVEDVLEHAACYGALEDTRNARPERLTVFTCEAKPKRAAEIPDYYMKAFENAAARYELGKEGIWTLAAVARVESDYGRGMDWRRMRETGPMGLNPEQWTDYGVDGNGDGLVTRDEPWDAISTFARMVWAKGGIEKALFDHNHAAWYVEAVERDAARMAGECVKSKNAWTILYPRPTTNSTATEINWDNLQILNGSAARDIQSGLIDARVINMLAYLTQRYSLLVSSLRTDHSMMTASGNISNHYYGRAVDIAAVNGVPCTDMSFESPCSQVGRLIVQMPAGARPTELIYGYDLDGAGPAFAMSDHRDHIHAGFGA